MAEFVKNAGAAGAEQELRGQAASEAAAGASQGETVRENAAGGNEIVPEFYDEMGIIGPDTKVAGNIVTKGHVTVLGSVKGDVTASGNVIIKGDVKGKIICDNCLIEGCSISADVEAKSQVSVKEGVTVKGKIDCGSISIMGTVIGNITAKDKVGLSDTAFVKGNISAAAMGTVLGARIDGQLSVGAK